MFALIINDRIVSKHRTRAAAEKAESRALRASRRRNGANSFLFSEIKPL
jgi:hypothetical protein